MALFAFLPMWGALAVGAAAISVPFIIHLLSRRRYRVVAWAAMRFLLAAQKQNTRRLRLEQLILLLVRTALVACLVLAMASVTGWAEKLWQTLAPGAAGFGSGRVGRTHFILVLDGSLSMGTFQAGGKNCFEKARETAAAVIKEMRQGDGVSILLMKDSPVWIVGEASPDPKKLLKELDAVRLPHGNSNVPAMLNAVAAKLQEGAGHFDAREVYFLTDLQQTTWIPDIAPSPLPGPAAGEQTMEKAGGQVKTLQEIQKRSGTIFVDVGREDVENAAVTMLALNEPLVTTNATVTFQAQVKNFGTQSKEKLNVKLLVGRWPAAAKEPELRLTQTVLRDFRPGEEQAVHFTHRFNSAGTYIVQVAIDGDELPLDDTRTVIVTVKDAVGVLVVNGKASLERFERATDYLAFALNPFVTLSPATGRPPSGEAQSGLTPFRPHVVSMAQFADANQINLADYDCVYLCDVGQLSAAEVRRLEANVRRGAGLVVSAGDNMAKHLESWNRLLWKNDRGLLPAKLLGLQSASTEHYFTFHAYEGFALPPLRAFIDQQDQYALQGVRFQQYLRTQPGNDATIRRVLTFMPEVMPGSKVNIDRTLPVNDPAMMEWNPPLEDVNRPISDVRIPRSENAAVLDTGHRTSDIGHHRYRGKVVLLTSSVNMDWTSWPASPSYLPLMHELTRFAASGRLREHFVFVGTPLEEVFTGSGELTGTLSGPGHNAPRTVKTQSNDDFSIFRWVDTDQSGIYRLSVGQDAHEYLFVVNVPTTVPDHKSSESDLRRTDKARLKESYPGWELQVVKDLSEVQHGKGGSTFDPDSEEMKKPKPVGPWIAHFLLLLMISLLFGEVVLACCFGHYQGRSLSTRSASLRGEGRSRWGRLPIWLGGGFAVVGLLTMAFLAVAVVEYGYSGDFLGFCMPDSVRAGIERWLDVPPPAPGESTKWTLTAGPILQGSSLYSVLVVAVLCLAGVAILLTSLFEARAGLGAFAQIGLGLIALSNIAVASTWLLTQPEIHFERQSWPDVALLIDDSLSMNGVDPYRDENARQPVTRLAERFRKYAEETYPGQIRALQVERNRGGGAKDEGRGAREEDAARLDRRIAGLQTQLNSVRSANWRPTRLQLAQAIVLSSNPDWLTALSKKNRLKIHIFHLDASGRALKLTDAGGSASDIIDSQDLERAQRTIASLEPYGSDSRLGTAVRQVIDYYRGASLNGVVTLTDGVTTRDESLAQVSEYAAQKGVPLFFVGIGEDQIAREIQLHDLQVEDPVFVNDRLIFEARLTGSGYKDLAIPVVLKVKDGDSEKELTREMVQLDPTGKAVKVRLKHQPSEPGEHLYILEAEVPKVILDELPPGAGERRLERSIMVQENKLIKVLYIEGSARYEYRYLKNLLEREKSDKKNSKSIDVKVLLVDSDEDYPRQDKTALAVFPPTRQELFQYDVVIVGDADPRSVKLGEPRLRDLADFVRVKGGGLLLIAGAQFMPHAYKDTPLASVMPIDIGKSPLEPEDRASGFNLEPTLAGRLHPIFRLVPDERDNLAIWQKLAPMFWWSEGYRPKPLADVLAVHPRVHSEGQGSRGQDQRHALVVQQYLGGARSMFFGFDESWRWRFREDELRFNQFWMQTVRYLARSKLTRTELHLDRQSKYQIGEPIKVTVRFPDSSALQGEPSRVSGRVVGRDEGQRARGETDAAGSPLEGSSKVVVTVEHRPFIDDKGKVEEKETEIQTLQLARVEGSWATYEGTLTKTREGEYRFWLSNPDVSALQPNRKKPSAVATVTRPPGEDNLRFNERELIQAAAASRSKEELALMTAAGRKTPGYYTLATADQLLEDLSLDTVAATGQLIPYSPRPPWPVWNLFLFSFLPVMMLLIAGWLLRKAVNLL
jgi:hypothetical protein